MDGSKSAAVGKIVLPPKLTVPRLKNTLSRERLYERLDQLRDHSAAIWISAPAGSGKTTLVGDYLAQRKLRSIWYQVDESDNDPASFFHYLGLAVTKVGTKSAQPLPHLTPEYLTALPLFTRHYFEALAGRLKPPFVIVFDNYQELGSDSPLHELLALAMELLPAGITLLVTSRVDPPPAFIRLRANGVLTLLGAEALRLTPEESAAVVQLRGYENLDAETLQRLHRLTDGWAAGVTLALEHSPATFEANPHAGPPQAVFDYFAAEIFDRTEADVQQVLLKSAFLPHITPEMAQQLTGNQNVGQILNELQRKNYFTYRHSIESGAYYQYHPLFHQFLLRRAAETFDSESLFKIRSQAAGLLAAAGQIEPAIELLIEAQSWQPMVQLLSANGKKLHDEGRHRTLKRWLSALPPDLLHCSPWALYWLGVCCMAFDPLEARRHIAKAYALFRNNGDVKGFYLSWAAVIDTFVYAWGDFGPVDEWIAEAEKFLREATPFPSPDIEARVTAGIFCALFWRQPQHPDLPLWAERLSHVVLGSDNFSLRIALGNNLVPYYLWMGSFSKAALVVDTLRSASRNPSNDQLAMQWWWGMVAMYSWFVADHNACLEAIAQGEALGERTGVHLVDFFMYGNGIYSGMTQGDLASAEGFLAKMEQLGTVRPIDQSLYHYMAGSLAWRRGELERSVAHSEMAVRISAECHCPFTESLCRIQWALALFDLQRRDEAERELALAMAMTKGLTHIEFLCHLFTAWFALQQGEQERGVDELRQALTIGAQQRYVNFTGWKSEIISYLCSVALEQEIEISYVQDLIRKRKIVPPPSAALDEKWPWPAKLYTLGRFSIELNGEPLQFSGRVQTKPLDLLKAIITLGEPDVAVAAVVEELWPQTKGKAGEEALSISLHRLRTLLGSSNAVVLRNNRLSLNPEMVWLDLVAFEKLTEQGGPDVDESGRLFDLYRGPFLAQEPDEPWLWPRRERLRSRLLRYIMRSGKALQEQQRYSDAIVLYERGLDVDELAEEFYSALMSAHIALGQRNEALSVYRRCEKTLGAVLGVRPSPETEAIYRSLRD